MTAQILNGPTPSGEYEESCFNAVGSCTWVLFQPLDDEDWVGVFGNGDYGKSAAASLSSIERAFVLAGGAGYLVNTAERRLQHTSTVERLQDVTHAESQQAFVVADELYVYLIDDSGTRWTTGRISWDGIRNLRVQGTLVRGEAWSPWDNYEGGAWLPFSLDLRTREVTGATYNGPDADY